MSEEPVVSASSILIAVVALGYGGYNLWTFIKGTPPPLCGTLRYVLGYWVGSTLYILLCIAFPILLTIVTMAAYYLPHLF